MRYIYTTLLVIIITFTNTKSQILNAGFEDWVNGDPVGWGTIDILGDAVSQTSDCHSGSSAAKIQIIDFMGTPIPPVLVSGQIAVNERFGSLNGYFKFAPQGNNIVLGVAVLMSKASNFIGGGVVEISQVTSTFTQFIVPIDYSTLEVPDSAYIQFSVADTSSEGTGGIGSYAIIDDLSFGGPTDVNDNQVIVNTYELGQNYPNPFNPSTQISFSLPEATFITLKVFNSLGEEVTTLVNGFENAGLKTVTFNASDLPSGIYYYRIQTDNYVETKKMILLK